MADLVLVRPMRGVLLVLAASLAAGCTSMQLDGVLVYGRLQDVSARDVREAIASVSAGDKVSRVAIVNGDEMHVYLTPLDLGWLPVRRARFATPPPDTDYSKWFPDGLNAFAPSVLHAIRTADEVYVFPVPTPLKPRRDEKHLRLLDGEARRKIIGLLGTDENWWHGAYHLIVPGPPSTDIGLIFRSRKNELVLFFLDYLAEGTLNGQNTSGVFDEKKRLQVWKRRYAAAELVSK